MTSGVSTCRKGKSIMNYAVLHLSLKMFLPALNPSVHPSGNTVIGQRVPSHVDAVISTDQLNVSQHSIEPYLRTQAVTDVQSPPFGGSVTRGSVVVFCFGEWDPGLSAPSPVAAES